MSDEPLAVGFMTRDEEIRATAATIAGASQATGDYKPSADTIITLAKQIEQYIRNGK